MAKTAYPKFQEKLIVCRDLYHGFDYSKFMTGTDLECSKAISGAVNFIVAVDKERKREDFLKEALLLKQALSLCSSLANEAEQMKIYRRTNVVKSEKFSEIIQSAMNRYLNGMLTNEQVIEELLKLAKQISDAQKEGDTFGLPLMSWRFMTR